MNILITGASSGIGKQLALDYQQAGHRVWGQGRHPIRLEQLAAAGVTPLAVELTDLKATQSCLSELPPLDLVILAAGNCEYLDPNRFDAKLFERVMHANLLSVANCLDALWQRLKTGSQLAIIGSLAHHLPFSRAGAYGSSKAAIAYLTKAIRTDLAPRQIRVHLIEPGFVQTPLTDRNQFKMPSLISTEQASRSIRRGLAKGQQVIRFPWVFSLFLLSLGRLPLSWQQALCRKMAKQSGEQV